MLSPNTGFVPLAKKIAKQDTKTVTCGISIPKTKIIKQPIQQPSKLSSNNKERTVIQKPNGNPNFYLIKKNLNLH